MKNTLTIIIGLIGIITYRAREARALGWHARADLLFDLRDALASLAVRVMEVE